jgi:chemotaxis protein methyltransferase CheR
MTPADMDFIAQLLKRRSGLIITAEKQYLLESRLTPVARERGLPDVTAVIAKLRTGDEALARTVVEAMTTNESFFFRDKTPFEQFEKVILPAMLKARASTKRLRIWCAAASSGQEPYSLSMILKEKAAQLADWRVEIVGTDISTEILARATAGVYSQFEVQRGLPIQLLMKYFKKEGEQWRISDELRSSIQYRTFNLLDPFTGLGNFDIVYCRNVLIYFDEATKRGVLTRIAQLMPADGFLLLGAAETVVGVTDVFAPMESARGLYVKNATAKPEAVAKISAA